MKISLPVAALAFGILGTQPLGAQFFENFGVPGAAPVRPTEDTASHPIGFQSPYAYFGTTNTNLPNQTVGIATSPSGYNTVSGAGSTTWRTFGDHTTGAGYLLMVNGSTQASGSGPYFYSHTVTGISAGSSFDFSFWAQQALTTVTNFATLQVGYSVNGGTSFSFLTPTNALVNYNAWTQVTASIPSSAIVGASSVMFALFDTSGVANGNAFAVDDISITAVPESGTVFAGVGALCLVGLALQRRLGSRAVQLVA